MNPSFATQHEVVAIVFLALGFRRCDLCSFFLSLSVICRLQIPDANNFHQFAFEQLEQLLLRLGDGKRERELVTDILSPILWVSGPRGSCNRLGAQMTDMWNGGKIDGSIYQFLGKVERLRLHPTGCLSLEQNEEEEEEESS